MVANLTLGKKKYAAAESAMLELKREAEALVRAGRETLRNTEQQVLLDAATAYADVVRDAAIVKLRENNVKVLTAELTATEARRAVREVTRTDLAQSQARRARAISALDVATGEAAEAAETAPQKSVLATAWKVLLAALPEVGKRAVIMVTHDPVWAAYAPRRVTFHDGHIVSDERKAA